MTDVQGVLKDVQCLVCGMINGKPVEEAVQLLGGQIWALQRAGQAQSLPDVIVSDSAAAKRLQAVLELSMSVPVVCAAWVTDCQQTGQRLPYQEYLLPALANCTISFTNLEKRRRQQLQPLVQQLGGKVAPDMGKHSTHLVVGNVSTVSMKLKAAKDWNMPVVSIAWLEETISKHHMIPLGSYQAQVNINQDTASLRSRSTTNLASAEVDNSAQVSSRQHIAAPGTSACADSGTKHEAAAVQSDRSIECGSAAAIPHSCASELAQADSAKGNAARTAEAEEPPHLQHAANTADTQTGGSAGKPGTGPAFPLQNTQAGPFEHKVLWFGGMEPATYAQCDQLLKQHKSQRRTHLKVFVTHIVTGQHCQLADKCQILEYVEGQEAICHVVQASWLIASAEAGVAVDESDHAVDLAAWRQECEGSIAPSQTTEPFQGKRFHVDSLDSADEKRQAREAIRAMGGQLLVDSMLSLVDDWSKVYALCPASMPAAKATDLRNRSKIFRSVLDDHRVNFFWLNVCRSTNTFLEPESCLFQPVRFAVPFPDFEKVCVLLSGFGDGIRQGVKMATELLGGTCVETVKKGEWERITHLVVDTRNKPQQNKKLHVCLSKGIPCVGSDWIAACLASGRAAPAESHLVVHGSGASNMTLTQSGDAVGATQIHLRPQTVSQGGMQPRAPLRHGLPHRQLGDASRSRGNSRPPDIPLAPSKSDSRQGNWAATSHLPANTDSSILRQLSQNLSVGPDSNSEPCDIRQQLQAFNGVAESESDAKGAARQGQQEAAQPQEQQLPRGPSVPQNVLQSFAQAHNVHPSEIWGSQKRPSPANLPAQGIAPKRACSDGAADLSRAASDPTAAQSASALACDASISAAQSLSESNQAAHKPAASAKPANKSALSNLAAQLGPYLGGATQCNSQANTQMLREFGSARSDLLRIGDAKAQTDTSDAAVGKKPSGSLRRARGKKDARQLPLAGRSAGLESTQVAFSQQVDFLQGRRRA